MVNRCSSVFTKIQKYCQEKNQNSYERERGGEGEGKGKKGRKQEIVISDSNHQVPTSHSIVAESLTKLIPNDEKNRNRELTKLTLYNNIHKTIMTTSDQYRLLPILSPIAFLRFSTEKTSQAEYCTYL